MRAIKGLLGFVIGLGLGLAAGYALISWLLEWERQRSLGAQPGTPASPSELAPLGLVDQVQRRVRDAVEEGRRAAAAARAELEAEAYGATRPTPAEAEKTVI